MPEAPVLSSQHPVCICGCETGEPAWAVNYLSRAPHAAAHRILGFDGCEKSCRPLRVRPWYRWVAINIPFFNAESLEAFDLLDAVFWGSHDPVIGVRRPEPTGDVWGKVLSAWTVAQVTQPAAPAALTVATAKKSPKMPAVSITTVDDPYPMLYRPAVRYGRRDAARMLGSCKRTLDYRISQKKISIVKSCKSVMVSRTEILRYGKTNDTESTEDRKPPKRIQPPAISHLG